MTKYAWLLLAALAAIVFAPAAFAAQAPAAGAAGPNWVALASGFGFAIAVAGCALGQGRATQGACEGLARNPGATASIRFALILGLVFIESLSLYMFAVLFLKVK
ncbi:MAG: ATP synthase F0 subunit C [Candidatus Acidiferrales bacterium]